MGKPREPEPVKLFMSILSAKEESFQQAMADLRPAFGEVDFTSERFLFHFTDYYTREMGPNLFRHFLTFEPLISASALPEIKQATNRIEERNASPGGNRRVNIDPGYLNLGQVILATTKGYTHRPYLREGIYADLTLIFRDRSYQALDWTYPDYAKQEIISLFNQCRIRYREALKRRQDRSC
jgi:hypothetical protein